MSLGDYPDHLRWTFWDKKKGTLPAGELVDKLKALQRKHDAVDFKPLDPGWTKAAGADLDDAYTSRQRLIQSKLVPLKTDAAAASSAAQRLGKDKASGKPTQDAVKLIVAAAAQLGKDIDQAPDDLRQAYEKARAARPAAAPPAPANDPDAALIDPKRVLQVLQQCKRDAKLRVQFAFVDGNDKNAALLAMHLKTTGRSMFAKLQERTPVRAGAFGLAWIDDNTLLLQPEKVFSGLPKRIRPPLMASGFRASNIVVVGANGARGESDIETELAEVEGDANAATGVAPGRDAAAFTQRLRALLEQVGALGNTPVAQELKQLLAEAGEKARAKAWVPAHSVLDRVERQAASANRNAPAATLATVAFTRSRLSWDETRKQVQEELRTLERSIIDTCQGAPDMAAITAGTKALYGMLEHLDERLIDKLDEALSAQAQPQRNALHAQALKIVGEYQAYVAKEELLRDIDDNGFVPVTIAATLTARLGEIARQLSASVAA